VPVDDGATTRKYTDSDSCQAVGLQMVVPRSRAHMESLLRRWATPTGEEADGGPGGGGSGGAVLATTSRSSRKVAVSVDQRYFHIVPGVYGVTGTTIRIDNPIAWQPVGVYSFSQCSQCVR
jgi:hypothetical protein